MRSIRLRVIAGAALAAGLLALGALQAAAGYTEAQKLVASDGAAGDRFGDAIDIDGNVAVVGAPYKNEGALTQAGAAYVYTWDGTWTQRSKLSTDLGHLGYFGDAVAIDGDTIVVGAWQKNWGLNAGAAYVFVWDGDSWESQARLIAPDAAGGDSFGYTVDISGDTIVVGSHRDDDAVMGNDAGSAYVFTRTGSTWSPQQKLTAADGAIGDYFGYDVALQGDTVLVGAQADDDKGSASGAVYVYTRVGSSWSEQAKITPADGATTDAFGTSVALDGDTAIIGAQGDDHPGPPIVSNHGSAYAFTRSGTTWSQQAKLTAPVLTGHDNLGGFVAFDDNMAILSAYGDDTMGAESGAAYVFARNGSEWALQKKLTASDGLAADAFGQDLAIQGSALLIGARMEDNPNGADAGSVYHVHAVANAAPVAKADGAAIDEDTTLTVGAPGALGNDTDADSDPLTAVKVTDPDHGTLTLGDDGSYTYKPDADFNGTDAFGYRASDGTTVSAIATVTINVASINDRPVGHDDTRTAHMDTALAVAAPGVLANDTDVDGDPLFAMWVSDPGHGTLALAANGSYLYTPAPGYVGPDQFTYMATDGLSTSDPVTVYLLVDPSNDLPVVAEDAYTVSEDATLSVGTPGVLGNDTDAEGDPLTATKVSGPLFGSLTLGPDGSFTYRAPAGWYGEDSFTYTANDGFGDSAPATVTITVSAVNDPPVAVADTYATIEDAIIEVSAPGLLANDSDAESATLVIWDRAGAQNPQHGTLSLTQDGWFRYRPDASWSGTDTFTYRCYDGQLYSNYATVTIGVANVNDPPAAYNDTYSATEDTTLVVSAPGVLGNDTDPDSPSLEATRAGAYASPQHGTLDFAADGSFTYVPDPNFHGSDTFSYFASDGESTSYDGCVTINVASVNDAPVSAPDTYTIDEDTTLVVTVANDVLGNDSDADGGVLTAVRTTDPVSGAITEWNSDGTFTYEPPADYHGTVTFSYRASDGTATSAPVTVAIVVQSVNDLPVAEDDAYDVAFETTLAVTAPGLLGNDTDADGDELEIPVFTQPAHGRVVFSAGDGSFVYRPDPGFAGIDTFTYNATDGQPDSLSNTATVSITVAPGDRAVTRIAARDRFGVAAQIARTGWDPAGDKTWPNVSHVIVANGENGKEADPLAAAGLAGVYDAPILLTQAASVPASTTQAIKEIAAANPGVQVHIVGGTVSVPDARWNTIKAIPGVSQTKDRIAGANRYDVTVAIAKRMCSVAGTDTIPGVLIVASDDAAAFYDALAASPAAFNASMPMLGVQKGAVPPTVAAFLSGPMAGKPRYVVSSSTYVAESVRSATGASTRLTTSADRYTAATQISTALATAGRVGYSDVGVASKLPDALTGGTFMGKRGGVLLFTDTANTIKPATASFLTAHADDVDDAWVLGGTLSVTQSAMNQIATLLGIDL